MSKKKPLQIEASFDVTDKGSRVTFELIEVEGRELSPQVILDTLADVLTARFTMTPEDWEIPGEGLDS